MNILVSACLLGIGCRYDGKAKSYDLSSLADHQLIPVCPEIYGGLSTPRLPCEQKDGIVVNCNGEDVTENYIRGAKSALEIALKCECKYALLKERSPSCGKGCIYDGSFSHTLCKGNGITVKLLMDSGIEIFGESEIEKLSERLK